MRIFISLCLCFLAIGCGPNFIIDLQNGYQLIVANSIDVSILDQNSRGVSANILELNTTKDIVFGKRENAEHPNGVTFFVLDTKANTVDTNLTQDSMVQIVRSYGVEKLPPLRRPTYFFRYLRNTDS